MLLQDERIQIVEYGKKMVNHGLTKGTGGNISICDHEQQIFLITPSGIDYFELQPDDIVVMDFENRIIEGTQKPSSEFAMHTILYRHRPEISAVVHTHSEGATVMACMGWSLPAFYYLNMIGGRNIRCTPYHKYGTKELAQAAMEGMKDRYAVYLGNHGLLAAGNSLARAFKTAEIIETASTLYIKCRTLGYPKLLKDNEIEDMLKVFHGNDYV